MEIGIYTIQLSQYVFRQEPISIEFTGILSDDKTDIEINGKLRYKGGGVTNISANITRDLENRAVIRGSKGTIIVSIFDIES